MVILNFLTLAYYGIMIVIIRCLWHLTCTVYIVLLYRKIELFFIPVARHHDASGHPAGTGHAGLCVEAVGGGGAWPGHWPQGGWSTDLQLHQKDRNGKVSGKPKMFLFTPRKHARYYVIMSYFIGQWIEWILLYVNRFYELLMFFMHRSCWHIVDSVYTYMFGNRACCRWKRSRSCRPCVRGSSPASYTPPWQEKRWNSSTRGAQCKSGKFGLVCLKNITYSSKNTHMFL